MAHIQILVSDISTAFSKMNKVSVLAPTQNLASLKQLHIQFVFYQSGSYCIITFRGPPSGFQMFIALEWFSMAYFSMLRCRPN